MHGLGILLLAAVAGYWVLERATGRRGQLQKVGLMLGSIVIVVSLLGVACKAEPQRPTRTKVVETAPLKIDRIYHSMQCPFERVGIDHTDLDWLTAVRTGTPGASR